MIDSSAVYAVIFFRSFVFLRINFSRLPFSRRVRSFPCATSRRGADAASFEAKVNSGCFPLTRCLDALYYLTLSCGCGQVVRQKLPKLSFAGSSPVTRSRYMQAADGFPSAAFLFRGECSSSPVVARSVYVVSNGVGGFSSMLYASDFCVLVLRFHFKRTRAVFKRGRYSAVLDRGLR